MYDFVATKYDKTNAQALRLVKRFLDDYFLLFVGSSRELHEMLSHMHKKPTIQLPMNLSSIENEPNEKQYDCEYKSSIPLLNNLISLEEGKERLT